MLSYPIQNIYNFGREIYLFNRQRDGKLTIQQDKTFFPYFYEESDKGIFQTIDNKKVNKIFCKAPSHVKNKRTEQSYEGDILYCLSPNTWIKMANGDIKQIKNIKYEDIVIAKNNSNYYCNKKIIAKWESKKIAYKIKTKSQTIIASKDHPFLTISLNKKIDCGKFQWFNTEFLRKGQFILQWMNYEKKPTNYRDDWFYLLGFYYGDGSHFNDKRNDYETVDKDEENLKTLGRILHKYNINYELKKSKYQNSYKLHFNSFNCNELKTKNIPYNFPIEYKLSFIEGIFDSEGTVGNGFCRITNTDEKLIYWISSILFSIGIPNKIIKTKSTGFGRKEVYYLDIYNIIDFEQYILIRSTKKYKKLVTEINKLNKSKSYNISKFDILPLVDLLKILASYGRLSGKGWRAKRSYFHNKDELTKFYKNLKVLKTLNGLEKNISRILARRVFNEIQEKALEKGYVFNRLSKQIEFILNNVFCSQITNIKYLGIKRLIDIQVKGENFIANNFASHNCKRYIIDKVKEILPSPTKYLFLDAEMKTKELPSYLNPDKLITCISIYNSSSKEIKTFWIKNYLDPRISVMDWNEPEDKLLKDFVKYVKDEQPDLILGWNLVDFDYPYLAARIQKLWNLNLSELISPIGKNRYGRKEDEIPYPAGISILDYLDLFKKIYKGEVSYSLDNISHKHLGTKLNKKVDFYIISDDIKNKNIEDVRRMVELEKQKKIIPYYDEVRRMGKCLWEDITWNSKVLDMMLLSEAKQKGIILPSKHYGRDDIDEIEFEGAYRRCDIVDKETKKVIKKYTGRYEGLWKLDISSAYPMAIIEFCLDIANLTQNKNELKINITNRETHEVKYSVYFKQNYNALLPSLARKLIIKKDYLKKQLKTIDPESEEGKDLQIKYDAVKALVNSLFGVTALKIFRLYNVNIASAITSIVRDLLHYVEDKLKELGIEVVYLDTDSFFVSAKENPVDLCNQLVQQWVKEKYNKPKTGIEFDYEGVFESILIVALCHYKGRLRKKDGKLKIEIKGIEAKRKDSSKFMQKFQTELIDKILDKEPKEAIEAFIASQKEAIKKAPLIDIGFPAKIANKTYKTEVTNKKGTTYKRKLPIFVRAVTNAKKILPSFNKSVGDTFWWLYYEE